MIFHVTASRDVTTLSLHDALPISAQLIADEEDEDDGFEAFIEKPQAARAAHVAERVVEKIVERITVLRERSEEHTSELQSRQYLVCRLLLATQKTAADERRRARHL